MHSTAAAATVPATVAAAAVSAAVAATAADATGNADASDADAGDRTEAAGTSALADVATRRRDLVGPILGGDVDMAVTLAADNRAILIAGDTGGSATGRGGDIVRRLQFGWPSFVDDRLHVEVILGRSLRSWLFRSNLAASVAVRDAKCSTAAGTRAPAVRRL